MQKPTYEKAYDLRTSYGYWRCPECGSQFYGGGNALHEEGCSKKGYAGLVYCYTQSEVDRWNREVLKEGYAVNLPLSPAGLSDYLLSQAIREGTVDPDQIRQITKSHVEKINARYLPQIMAKLEDLIADQVINTTGEADAD